MSQVSSFWPLLLSCSSLPVTGALSLKSSLKAPYLFPSKASCPHCLQSMGFFFSPHKTLLSFLKAFSFGGSQKKKKVVDNFLLKPNLGDTLCQSSLENFLTFFALFNPPPIKLLPLLGHVF